MNLLMFSSCLGSSNDGDLEYSPDAQIYSFSIASKADTLNLLRTTDFTIDQVNGRIFNKKPLPYQFHVDSIIVNIVGANTYDPFMNVSIQLIPDSTFTWSQSDSIDVSRLYKITTTAPDGINKKTYEFQLNIYQQDPYILSWEKMSNGYLPQTAVQQKTISFNNRFITYYIADGTVNAVSSAVSDGKNWTSASLKGLPPAVLLSTITVAEEALFATDDNNRLFSSSDGYSWGQVITDYPVVAIYGILPSATSDILVMVDDNGTLKLAKTIDFTSLQFIEINSKNVSTSNLPVKNFTTTQIESVTSYAIKYIAIAGGKYSDDTNNNDIWILQEKNNKISVLKSKKSETVSIEGSSIFFYDEKPYILTASSEKNSLLYSENYGLDWKAAAENQALPATFNFRKNASVVTDNNNIWIFGGISQSQTLISDVWKGRLNKFDLN
ncbi:MAG: DUF6242 domain-containing protein [Fermentimonas sp.]|nr:DUF6242 domain-containing protein [Fermentimonas sp.]